MLSVAGVIAFENPTIALSVKTRQAIRIVLNAQHDTVKQLKEEGALQDTDAALLTKVTLADHSVTHADHSVTHTHTHTHTHTLPLGHTR